MPVLTQAKLSDQINDALAMLYQPQERPIQYALGATALDGAGTVITFTLANPSTTAIGDVLENGEEQMRITAQDSASPPNLTVIRGYNGTPFQSANTGAPILRNPLWYRWDVRRQILRAYKGALERNVPNMRTWHTQPVLNQFYVFPPSDCMEVVRVAYVQTDNAQNTSKWEDIREWTWEDDVDTVLSPTGNLLTIPVWMAIGQNTSTVMLYVTYRGAYTWISAGNSVAAPGAPTVTALQTGSTKYSYEITAVNANGETTASTATTITNGNGTPDNSVSWGAVSGAVFYNVYRQTGGSGSYLLVGSSVTTSFTDTTATPGTATPPGSNTALLTTDNPSESNGDYINVDTGQEDLAPLYAASMLSTGREIGRLELQRVENWAHEAEIRNGANVRLITMLWQEFYRRCDEQKRNKIIPKHRPYRRMARTRFYWNGGL